MFLDLDDGRCYLHFGVRPLRVDRKLLVPSTVTCRSQTSTEYGDARGGLLTGGLLSDGRSPRPCAQALRPHQHRHKLNPAVPAVYRDRYDEDQRLVSTASPRARISGYRRISGRTG